MTSEREQIIDLMTDYGWACDTRDWELLASCFTPDAAVTYEGFGAPLKGPIELETYLKGALAPLDATQHLFSNFRVVLDGNTASFRCGMRAQHLKRSEPHGQCFMVGGTYNVELRKTEDGWQMSALNFAPIWTDGNPEVLHHIIHPGVDTSRH